MKYIGENVVLKGKVTIQDECSLWHNCVLRGDQNTITIGKMTNIQDLVMVHTSNNYPVHIGNHVTIGHSSIIHGCTIEDTCLIGMGSILMNGCRIGKGSIVGAGSLITQNRVFPPYSLIMGSPAKLIRSLEPEEIESIQTSATEYLQYAKESLDIIND